MSDDTLSEEDQLFDEFVSRVSESDIWSKHLLRVMDNRYISKESSEELSRIRNQVFDESHSDSLRRDVEDSVVRHLLEKYPSEGDS